MDYIDWYAVFKLLFVLMLALHLLQHVPGTDHRHLKRNWWNQLVITGLFAYAILFFFVPEMRRVLLSTIPKKSWGPFMQALYRSTYHKLPWYPEWLQL